MSGGVPAGWVLVPVECTDDIAEAIAMTASVCGGIAESTWREALAAARATPTPPSRDADVERVEKVARALYEEDDPWHKAWPWPDLNPEAQGASTADTYRRFARAALQALGERG